MKFNFIGAVAPSKSLLNRLLILKSYAPQLHIPELSDADDVQLMRRATLQIQDKSVSSFDCGHAGTVLRFLALRVAREKGEFVLRGSSRLFSRPQQELYKLLRQLGSLVEVGSDFLRIQSDGWHLMGDQIFIDATRSSQFASALLLNSWDLPFDLFFRISSGMVSEPYFSMTQRLVTSMGMRVRTMERGEFHIPMRQRITSTQVPLECDMSSAFALAACAVAGGQARITGWPETSLQPDFSFVEVLYKMGVKIKVVGGHLDVDRTDGLLPVKENLSYRPDMFPVLAALCVLAEGESELSGLSQLEHKESNRLENMIRLLTALGIQTQKIENALRIKGCGRAFSSHCVVFDADLDHRLVMAATVLRLAGAPLTIVNAESVTKSFPEFLQIVGVEV